MHNSYCTVKFWWWKTGKLRLGLSDFPFSVVRLICLNHLYFKVGVPHDPGSKAYNEDWLVVLQ